MIKTDLVDIQNILCKASGQFALLVGNGLSSRLWSAFGYSDLFDEARKQKIFASHINLFKFLDTRNFEEVLRALEFCSLVGQQFNFDQRELEKVNRTKREIKETLLETIKNIHPAYSKVEAKLRGIFVELTKFSRIFSTNYDLLLYWAIFFKKDSFTDRWVFKDESWDFLEEDHYSQCTHLYFLHGVFYLGTDRFGKLNKIEADSGKDLLDKIREEFKNDKFFPLYVAEGISQKKMDKIKNNSYLRMAYEKLRQMESVKAYSNSVSTETIDDLLIFGHNLDKNFDSHIIDAILFSKIKNIYYGVHDKNKFSVTKSRIQDLFNNKTKLKPQQTLKNLYFFDSDQILNP